jgi:hypothetical protein
MAKGLLDIEEIASVVADQLKVQRKDILGHVGRLFGLLKVSRDQMRNSDKRLSVRLTVLEAQVRNLRRDLERRR